MDELRLPCDNMKATRCPGVGHCVMLTGEADEENQGKWTLYRWHLQTSAAQEARLDLWPQDVGGGSQRIV